MARLAGKTAIITGAARGIGLAALMLYLASDEARFCTGGVYQIDGGVIAG